MAFSRSSAVALLVSLPGVPLVARALRLKASVIAAALIMTWPAVEMTAARASSEQAPVAAGVHADRLITSTRVGVIALGMTLAEARKRAVDASFTRTSDGDGAALVQITLAANVAMQVWADEDDPQKPINWTKPIRSIETFSRAFRTAKGAHPGAKIRELNRLYGKTKGIVTTEIESRRYITLATHPAGLLFRVDETGEAILSIAIRATY